MAASISFVGESVQLAKRSVRRLHSIFLENSRDTLFEALYENIFKEAVNL